MVVHQRALLNFMSSLKAMKPLFCSFTLAGKCNSLLCFAVGDSPRGEATSCTVHQARACQIWCMRIVALFQQHRATFVTDVAATVVAHQQLFRITFAFTYMLTEVIRAHLKVNELSWESALCISELICIFLSAIFVLLHFARLDMACPVQLQYICPSDEHCCLPLLAGCV